MSDKHETIADIRKDAEAKFRELVDGYMQRRAAFQTTVGAMQAFNTVFDRIEAAHKREITILIDALAEVVASIEVRFPAIEYALDRKPYLDAKKILEQYKEEAILATTSTQNTQEEN